MTALHTYTCKKTGLHIIAGNMNFSNASGGMRAYDISFGGKYEKISLRSLAVRRTTQLISPYLALLS